MTSCATCCCLEGRLPGSPAGHQLANQTRRPACEWHRRGGSRPLWSPPALPFLSARATHALPRPARSPHRRSRGRRRAAPSTADRAGRSVKSTVRPREAHGATRARGRPACAAGCTLSSSRRWAGSTPLAFSTAAAGRRARGPGRRRGHAAGGRKHERRRAMAGS
eukprot:scaffold298742_cov33-Tisochrysis_lutea.AAC.1